MLTWWSRIWRGLTWSLIILQKHNAIQYATCTVQLSIGIMRAPPPVSHGMLLSLPLPLPCAPVQLRPLLPSSPDAGLFSCPGSSHTTQPPRRLAQASVKPFAGSTAFVAVHRGRGRRVHIRRKERFVARPAKGDDEHPLLRPKQTSCLRHQVSPHPKAETSTYRSPLSVLLEPLDQTQTSTLLRAPLSQCLAP